MADLSVVPITQQATFDDFWLLYPRRVAKKAARIAWAKLTDVECCAAICACAAWRSIWAQKDPEYMPHPASWLNGERWDDELPAGVQQSAPINAPPKLGERTPMPDHVRALIAKLRK